MTGFLSTTRFQIRALAALAVVALVLLGGARDAGATQKGVAVKVITSGIIACEAMGGTATVDTGFENATFNNPNTAMIMSCSGGNLDGWSCAGFDDFVSCGSNKLATPASGGQRPSVDAVVRRSADLPTAEVGVVEGTAPERDVVEEPAPAPEADEVEETAPKPDAVEVTEVAPERGETAVVDASIVVDAEPVADAVVAELPPVEVVTTAPDVQTSEVVEGTVAADEER